MIKPSNCFNVPVIPDDPATDTEHTQALLAELQSIIFRLQSQIDEVSHHLDIALSRQTHAGSSSHIATLNSLKKSLQIELNDNLATLQVWPDLNAMMGVYLDDPSAVEEQNLRSFACAALCEVNSATLAAGTGDAEMTAPEELLTDIYMPIKG